MAEVRVLETILMIVSSLWVAFSSQPINALVISFIGFIIVCLINDISRIYELMNNIYDLTISTSSSYLDQQGKIALYIDNDELDRIDTRDKLQDIEDLLCEISDHLHIQDGVSLDNYPNLVKALNTMTIAQLSTRVPVMDQYKCMDSKDDWIKCILESLARKTTDNIMNGESIWVEWNRLPLSVQDSLNQDLKVATIEFLDFLAFYNKE